LFRNKFKMFKIFILNINNILFNKINNKKFLLNKKNNWNNKINKSKIQKHKIKIIKKLFKKFNCKKNNLNQLKIKIFTQTIIIFKSKIL
jgi:hypothetical protein